MRRHWARIVGVVVLGVAVPTLLLWFALVTGKIWPFNDNYFDPHTEISKSYHRHPDAFHDVAYHVLATSKQQPDALLGKLNARGNTPSWQLNRADKRLGSPVKKRSPREDFQLFPDVPGVPGGRTIRVSWQHSHPDCVFFFYAPNVREDWEKIDVLKRKWTILPPRSVVLAYHPANKPPQRFIDDNPLPLSSRPEFLQRRKQDPLFLGFRRDWKSESINQHWTVYTW